MANYEQGYEDDRFEKEVDRNLHCPICQDVLKDPLQCRRNQHLFCSPCIKRYLHQHSETCPTCREALTEETLVQPARILIDLLSSLKIYCDFVARGCPELIELEFLKRHVEDCGYSPVKCKNDGCLMIVNKGDKEHHENNICGFRMVKCDDCGEDVMYKKFNTHGCALMKEIDEMKINLMEVKDQLGMRHQTQRNQEEMMQEIRLMKAEMKEFMNNSTKKANEIKDEMKGVKQSMGRLPNANTRRNIVVAGGFDGKSQLNSVETFSWLAETWEPRQSMKQQRNAASSFVYQQQMFVAGGIGGGKRLDSLERLNMDDEPGQWLDFNAKLPNKLTGHTNVVYQNRLIVTGGYTDKEASDEIYEVRLTPPYSSKLLGKMPQPRACHCSQLFDDKIFTFGGRKTLGLGGKKGYDSVLLYNITTNTCEQKAPLPFAVDSTASVSWNDDVILMGGKDKNGDVLNTVVKYNVKTGKNELLPPMKYKRSGCAAVVTGNVVVVMGGWNKEQLNSAEYFSFDRYVWEELPAMIEKRTYPVVAC